MDSLAPPVPERFDDMHAVWRLFWYALAVVGVLLLVSVLLAGI